MLERGAAEAVRELGGRRGQAEEVQPRGSKGINQGEHDAQRESGSAAAAKRRGQGDRGSGVEVMSSFSTYAKETG